MDSEYSFFINCSGTNDTWRIAWLTSPTTSCESRMLGSWPVGYPGGFVEHRVMDGWGSYGQKVELSICAYESYPTENPGLAVAVSSSSLVICTENSKRRSYASEDSKSSWLVSASTSGASFHTRFAECSSEIKHTSWSHSLVRYLEYYFSYWEGEKNLSRHTSWTLHDCGRQMRQRHLATLYLRAKIWHDTGSHQAFGSSKDISLASVKGRTRQSFHSVGRSAVHIFTISLEYKNVILIRLTSLNRLFQVPPWTWQ